MQELEKILKEIKGLHGEVGSECTIEDRHAKRAWEHCLKRVEDIICKHMNDAEYPYITEKDIEAVPPASKEFLDECRSVAKKYGKNDGWIPIEKELPKKGENVLLCSDDGRMMIGVFQNDYYTAFGVAVAENYNQTMHNCVAWQSLPEPYRPERRDDHDRE